MSRFRLLAISLAALALQGCLAKAAVSVVTAPVRVVSKGVDLATTSQSEADEKRGREIRERDERLGELDRAYAKQIERCRDGDAEACDKAEAINAESEALLQNEPQDD